MLMKFYSQTSKGYLFLFLIFLVFFDCQKNEIVDTKSQTDDAPISNEYKNGNVNFRNVSFSMIKDNKNFKNLFSFFNFQNSLYSYSKSNVKSTTDYYGFVIDSTNIKQVVKENYLSYTFNIQRAEDRVGYIENLLVEVKNGVEKAYIISYIPDDDWLKDHFNQIDVPFHGNVRIEEINKSIDEKSSKNTLNSKSAGSCGSIYIYIDTSCPCAGHWPGQECNCYQKPTSTRYTLDLPCEGEVPTEGSIGPTGGGGGYPSDNTGPGGGDSATVLTGSEDTEVNTAEALNIMLELNMHQSDWLSNNIDFSNLLYSFVLTNKYSNEAKAFAKSAIGVLSLPMIISTNQMDYVTQILRLTNHLKLFGNVEDEIYADYIESLIPEFNSMTINEVREIYNQVKNTCNELTIKYAKAIITPIVTDLIIPVVTYALFEATAGTAIKLLEKIPVSMVLRSSPRLNAMVLKTTELGEAGVLNSRLIPNSTITKTEKLFQMLTKDAISIMPASNNSSILVADMGIGRKIILRPMSTTVPEAISVIEYQNFNTALGTNSFTLKFLPW